MSKITSDKLYHNKEFGWPSLILFKDSLFSFNYVVPGKFNFANQSYPEKYFVTKGHWKLKKRFIILTSSSDSLAHNAESSHPLINPLVKSSADTNFSTFFFNDVWGYAVKFKIANRVPGDDIDTIGNVYKINLKSKIEVLTFFFQSYEPYLFKNSETINKDYDVTLQPKYYKEFFLNDTFKIYRKKIIDTKRKLELEKF